MPDIMCKPGWAGAVQLKLGASQIDVPVLRAGYQRFDGRQIEMLAQGNAQNAYPVNSSKTPDSSVLNITARAFTSWFTAANLNSLFVTRDTNGATGGCDWKVNNGIDAAVDSGKGSALRIACSAGQGPLSVDMSFLGKANGSSATFTAPTAQAGQPFYHNCITFAWTPFGAGTSSLSLTLVEDFALTLMTGVQPGKWFDCADGMSNIDQGVQSGSLVITQRAGATNRMDASASGKLVIGLGAPSADAGVIATLQLVRLDVGHPIDPMGPGGAKIPSTWALLSETSSNSIVFTAIDA